MQVQSIPNTFGTALTQLENIWESVVPLSSNSVLVNVTSLVGGNAVLITLTAANSSSLTTGTNVALTTGNSPLTTGSSTNGDLESKESSATLNFVKYYFLAVFVALI